MTTQECGQQAHTSQSRARALSRWEGEGGALVTDAGGEIPELTNAELVHLRIRVIALENLLIAVLAEGPDRQRSAAREMAAEIAPRPGFTQHPLTLQASKHMADIVERAAHFSDGRSA